MIQNDPPESTTQPPLAIVLERLDVTPDGHFRPSAFVKLTKAFRTSGLLQSLPPEELKSFLMLLSFLTPNGDCSPTLAQLSSAMRVSQPKVKARMQRLSQFRFEGEPLVIPTVRGDRQEAYALSHKLIPVIEQPIEEIKTATVQAVPREQLIEYSRNRYAKTREEVEKQIAELNGWYIPKQGEETQEVPVQQVEQTEFPHRQELRRQLQNVGIAPDQIEYLFSSFEDERIVKQLRWLPYRRHARNPSAYLVAAIVGDYEEPIYRR